MWLEPPTSKTEVTSTISRAALMKELDVSVPVVPINIKNPANGKKTKVNALLDVGANTHALAKHIAENILGLKGEAKDHFVKVAGGDILKYLAYLGIIQVSSLEEPDKFHTIGIN